MIRRKPVTRSSLPARFNIGYLKDRSVEAPSGCREWTNSLNGEGYAQVGVWPYNAHVISFVLSKGELTERELVRHICHNRKCVNPNHLEKGTSKDNWEDSEEVHRESQRRRRGRPAVNRIRVEVDGQVFSSKVEAMERLKRGPRYIEKHGKPL